MNQNDKQASDSDETTLIVQLANQFINVANSQMSDGKAPMAIAAGIRHAGANFTAFALVNSQQSLPSPDVFNNEFNELLSYYYQRHNASSQPALGLQDLIEKAKNDF